MLMIFLLAVFEVDLGNISGKLGNLSIALLTFINILGAARGEQIPEIRNSTVLERVIIVYVITSAFPLCYLAVEDPTY